MAGKNCRILLLEAFYSGSHKRWAEELKEKSRHHIDILSLPGRFWKWRMHAGSINLAKQYHEERKSYDLILATDMMDVSLFLSLCRDDLSKVPTALYFHENQLSYPWSPTDQDLEKGRDNHYAFINYSGALVADFILFNSPYHKDSFLSHLPKFLDQFPDFQNKDSIPIIKEKSEVLPIGMHLEKPKVSNKIGQKASILWNHRWEYDKNPEEFFTLLFELKSEGVDFEVIVLGEQTKTCPAIFHEAEKRLANEIYHFGYVEDRENYLRLLARADIVPVSSNQDFFGMSVVEAMAQNCYPILPNRLAYPMHIPDAHHKDHFYSSYSEFKNKTQQAIQNVERIRSLPISSWVQRYDWNYLINSYDDSFEKMSIRIK